MEFLGFILDRIYQPSLKSFGAAGRISWIFSFGRSPAWRAIAVKDSDGGKRAPKPQSPPARVNILIGF